MALLTAFAILRWLRGLRPVSLLCLILPISVTYSDMMLKFCTGLCQLLLSQSHQLCLCRLPATYLVVVHRVQIELIQHIPPWSRTLL